MATESPIVVPDGFKLHTENASHILLPSTNEAFLNPVQEFNRDISVACIRVWSEEINREKEAKWTLAQARKARKPEGTGKKKMKSSEAGDKVHKESSMDSGESDSLHLVETAPPKFPAYRFILLEALSATGLRSIRYAKEIPLVKYVIANDLSSAATEAMKRNVEINGLSPQEALDDKPKERHQRRAHVRINEGDACTLMYSHREERKRVDVVDLDPYGTAAPFIDAAVQCVLDGGLLCVTCTDLSVLATTNYPEKCFSNYGGVPLKAEYCHEAALRLVLQTISASASRYGRYIQPLLSLSIDFYVRIFVRVRSSPLEVKRAMTKSSIYYICTGCQSHYEQPLGRMVEKVHEPTGNVNYLFKTHSAPTIPDKCPECSSSLHLAGPMWSGHLHDSEFVSRVLEHLDSNEDKYGTSTRMKGMLTVAKDELHSPFYFTPAKIAGFFHCTCPPLEDVASALFHAGHQVSRSHACPGSLKTSGSRSELHDIFRSWVKHHPVKMENISESSPAYRLLANEPKLDAVFTRHPSSANLSKIRLVRYQQNPTSHWGPGTKANKGTKRKLEDDEDR